MNRGALRFISLLLAFSMTAAYLPAAAAEGMEEPEVITAVQEETPVSVEEPGVTAPAVSEQIVPNEEAEEEIVPSETDAPVVEETVPSEEAVEETAPTEEAIPEETEPAAEENDPAEETEPSEETEPAEETEPIEETEPTEETEPVREGYFWEDMTDEEFVVFILEEQGYLAYEGDTEACMSILNRADAIEDEELRLQITAILAVWLSPIFEELELLAPPEPYSAAKVSLTLAELNASNMFIKQSTGGTCTLAANAMLVRRSARLNGYSNWEKITESALRPVAWIEGTGMTWNYSYAGITVGHDFFSSCNLDKVLKLLEKHPEGFVAYNGNKPHAVLITDYTNGKLYCADPGLGPKRIPVADSVLSRGGQTATIAGFTAYWYVTSPKLSVADTPNVEDVQMTLTAKLDVDNSIVLNWNSAGASGYWVYRSESPDGPWDKPIYDAGSYTTTWTDTTAQLLHTYYYRVQSYNSSKVGVNISDAVSVTPDRGTNHIADGVCGENIHWALYNDGVLLLVGSGAMYDYSSEAQEPWYYYRNSIREVYFSEGITTVGRSAFGGCTQISSVSLCASIAEIRDWAFNGCSGLASVAMQSGLKSIGYAAFRQCGSLRSAELPASVTSIGDWAFSNCTRLESVSLPDKLTAIGSSVFYEDSSLKNINMPENLQSIGEHAFRSCTSLSSLSFPKKLESVGSYAFAMCSGLKEVSFSNSTVVLTLCDGAFYNCTSLGALTLPTVQIGNSAFAYCYGLNYVTIAQGTKGTSVADNAFYGSPVKVIMITGSAITYSAYAFNGTSADIYVSSSANGGDFVRTEGGNTWRSYRAGGAVTPRLFWYLDSEGMATIFGVDAIPNYHGVSAPWVASASSVKAVTVASTVPYIGERAFYGCGSNLKKIYFPANPPAFHESALKGVSGTVHYHNADGSWTGIASNLFGGSPKWAEKHAFVWELEAEPTFETAGLLTAQCYCGAEETAEIPVLDKKQYTYTDGENEGLYTWKTTAYGEWCFSVPFVTVVENPADQNVTIGEKAVFHVAAEGYGLTYRWQWKSAPTETSWTNCSSSQTGYKSDTLNPSTSKSKNNSLYRCAITDANGAVVYSEQAQLHLYEASSITKQPVSQSVKFGQEVSFAVSAVGANLTYQWQEKAPGEDVWNDSTVSGFDTDTLRPQSAARYNGYTYRCVITDAAGKTLTTKEVTLTVASLAALRIASQPVNATVQEDMTASFVIRAEGDALRYQWQWKPTAASTLWLNCTSATEGYQSAVLKPVATESRNGYRYRCVITDAFGNTVMTQEVTLTVIPSLTITSQPLSRSASENSSVYFYVGVTGSDLTYRWQWRASSDVPFWTNCTAVTPGYNTAVLRPTANLGHNGYQYRCMITNSRGEVVRTLPATLYVTPAIMITSQPVSSTYTVGQLATFRVAASGKNLSYQWQVQEPGSNWTNLSSQTFGALTPTVHPVAYRNGSCYRCMISDSTGRTVVTNSAVLYIRAR